MNRGIISTRYAKGLLLYALDCGASDEIYKQISILTSSFDEVPELAKVLENPVIAESEKVTLIKSAAGGAVSAEFDKFISLIFANKREHLLRYIAIMYIQLYQRNNNISICNIQTAVPISEEIEKNIITFVSDKTHGKVELKKSIKPEILGGFIFELNYNRLDASIASQLKKIRLEFETINNR